MARTWWLAVARLTALLTGVGLATTRIGLVLHELLGHGGTAVALGGELTEVKLFWFAGGWIRYRASHGELAVAMGGIAVEAVVGALIWVGARRRDALGGRIARGIGAALVIHAGWYLATGTWHGYGDGVQLHRELGDAKWVVAVPAGVITVIAAYAGARAVIGALAATLPGSRRARIAGTVAAIAVAGGIQLGAAVGEVQIRRDASYGQIMRPERDRAIADDLARWNAEQARRGAQPTDAERAAMQRELDRRHQTFPFAWLLGALTLAAIGAGAARPQRGSRPPEGPVGARLLVATAIIACGSVAAVIALPLVFH